MSVVELQSVARSYPGPPETIALRNCTLTVQNGDFVTVVGPSGSGKSTLLNVVGLLDRPTSRRNHHNGRDMSALSENERARARGENIGFVFQSYQLMERRTCLENVMVADLYRGVTARESRAAASAALEAVGMADRSEGLPLQLSGGQRQRVAIARALMGMPSVLLCDEPTGNLDSKNSDAVLDLFLSLNAGGTTIILITHDLGVAERGSRQVSILDGVVEETTKAGSA